MRDAGCARGRSLTTSKWQVKVVAPDPAPYVAAWKKRIKQQEEENARLRRRARRDARKMARVLGEEFGVQRVYLFGSVLRPGYFCAASDIDLAVEGLAPDLVYRAERRLEEITRFPFDLVELEEAMPELAEQVRQEGEVLYEAPAEG